MDELLTWRSMPTSDLSNLDPFLFLNHHGPATYPEYNRGLPFGPHPHRGFETLTFVFEGDVKHKDSTGGESTIGQGGVQWMTAGRGIIHTEVSSQDFMEKGGTVHLIQLWMNLPASLKMTKPNYQGFTAEQLVHIPLDNGMANMHLISGDFNGSHGPAQSITNLFTSWIDLKKGATLQLEVYETREVLLYIIFGSLQVNSENCMTHAQVQFEPSGTQIEIKAMSDASVIFCHGIPYNEPVVSHGPFVMNTETEILQAIRDYQMGKMGVWIDG